MSGEASLFLDPGALPPVLRRRRWIGSGLLLQVIGVAIPAVVVLLRAKHDSVVGQVTRYTVRLAWHEVLRSPANAGLIGLGVAVFVVGSVALARPFAKRRSTLLIGVPLAAVLGILVLGVGALICAIAIALADTGGLDLLGGFDGGWSGGRKKGGEDPPEDPPPGVAA